MSLAPPTETNTPPTGSRSRRSRSVYPGASLLAQGEPFVWLTGASLVLCLTMIAGIVSLIIYFGSITFWPLPVVRVALHDGSAQLGEITRAESYALTADKVNGLAGEAAAAANKQLGTATSVDSHRRLFRTGNFELTQSHFRWVDDYEIQTGSETQPAWAVVLERIEWGRFYGEVREFATSTPREPTMDERDHAAFVEFLESNQFRLEESEQQQLAEPLAQLHKHLLAVRTRNIRDLVKSIDAAESMRIDATTEDRQIVRASELPPEQNILDIQQVWETAPVAWSKFQEQHADAIQRAARRRHLERDALGAINDRIEAARLQIRATELQLGISLLDKVDEFSSLEHQLSAIDAELDGKFRLAAELRKRFANNESQQTLIDKMVTALKADAEPVRQEPQTRMNAIQDFFKTTPDSAQAAVHSFLALNQSVLKEREEIQRHITRLNEENQRYELRLATTSGQLAPIKLADIVIAYPANQLDWFGKLRVYAARWREFLLDEPREANSEGGVFPAIVGTVVMTLFMSLAVVPFGVLAALYLREYAQGGLVVSVIRIAINNLAGVPSIVFGVFGLGFFCYIVGAYVDGGPQNAGLQAWSAPTWLLGVGLLSGLATTAFLCGFLGMAPRGEDTTRKRRLRLVAVVIWLVATVLLVALIFFTPYFQGFYATKLPNPTFGKGGLIWASLTLSLLTLPVVIVSTEEALSAVPNSMREGSYACGAGKWQTLRRIVLPQAAPGIMTGLILAMARGAGEVAPLMLVGAVKLAPELPWIPHRSFMHLGFHIYDLGFQSPNSEAAKPMVYTTTLLLILIIAALNIAAVWLRARLRKRFKGGQF